MNTAPPSTTFRRFVPPAVLAVAGVFLAGCASNDTAFLSSAVAAGSPRAQVVSPLEVNSLARDYVAGHPGTDFMVGSGDSMKPLYGDHTVIITERMPFSGLKPGMTVVFVGDCGYWVAHVLVRKTSEGWIAMGVNNARYDSALVCDDNYMAVVVKAYEPTSSPMLTLFQRPTSYARGAVIASSP